MADYFDTGFAVRKPSWHAKETLLTEAPTLDTWRQAAGLEWEPVKVPLYLPAPIVAMNDDGVIYGQAKESGTFAIVRNDRIDALTDEDPTVRDTAVLSRGVSAEYTPIEHEADMTPLVEALFMAADGLGVGAEFTTAGSVRDGKQVYACIMLDRPIEVPGDASLTLPFGVLLNSHDGTGACRGGLTQVRVVCANTYAMSEADMDGHQVEFKVRHSGTTDERLAEARQAIAGWLDAIESYTSMTKYLVSLRADSDVCEDFLDEFLPVDERQMTERQVNRRNGEREAFRQILVGSETTEGIRGTAYGLWQTAVEFADHVRPWRSADAYMRRTMLEPERAKVVARDRIVAMCESGV